jgi:hypothetical protein
MTNPPKQFFDDVRAVVRDHWSGLPEDVPDEAVWARLDRVLFDDEGISRVEPDWKAAEDITGVEGEAPKA